MTPRLTATIAICALAGGATALALARPAATPQASAAVAHGGAAHGGAAHDGAAETATPAVGADITIADFAFAVSGVYAPGQTVTIANIDGAPHTLTADDGSFDTGTIDGGGATQLTLPTEPGTYSFFCAVHPSMTGTITISG